MRNTGVRELRGSASTTSPHRWQLVDQGDLRDTFICAGCDMRVEVKAGYRPCRDISKMVNGKPVPLGTRLPSCTTVRGAKLPNGRETDAGHLTSPEWRDVWATVCDHCGDRWTRQQLGLSGARLSEDQEIELLRLHAAVRVRLLDADDALIAVERRETEMRRERLTQLAEGHGGELHAAYEGARRVPAAGGAM